MSTKISGSKYAAMYGPTTGDKVRLADTSLVIEVEKDYTTYGDEVKFGGGKTIRDGMGQSVKTCSKDGDLDLVITNALIVDSTGIVKADIGIKDGKIKGIGKAGNPDMVYKIGSTAKITFPGSAISAIATSKANIEDMKKQMNVQFISHDKINQLRHVRFFKNIDGLKAQMAKHAEILRPKFEAVDEILNEELGGLEIGKWTKPNGGYFVSFDSLDGCAKAIVAKCKEAGVVMTGAGATYPYGKDPHDSNIRIAPSFPSLDDLRQAAEIFCVCVKLVSVEKLLAE